MTNVDIVKEVYANFVTGNVPAVSATFDSAIEWNECKGMPFMKDDTILIGPEAVVTNIFMQLPVYFDNFNVAITDIFGAKDKVTMMGYYPGINKQTSNTFKANATHVWTAQNGKLTHFFRL